MSAASPCRGEPSAPPRYTSAPSAPALRTPLRQPSVPLRATSSAPHIYEAVPGPQRRCSAPLRIAAPFPPRHPPLPSASRCSSPRITRRPPSNAAAPAAPERAARPAAAASQPCRIDRRKPGRKHARKHRLLVPHAIARVTIRHKTKEDEGWHLLV